MKPICELLSEMISTGNGMLDRFMIIVPDSRKVDPDERDAAYERMDRTGITVSALYQIVSKLDPNSDNQFYFSTDALK